MTRTQLYARSLLVCLTMLLSYWGFAQNQNAPTLVKDIATGSAGSNPRSFATLSSGLSFFIAEENNLTKLFKTDGTTAGTQVVSGSPTALSNGLAVLNGKVYFITTQSTATKVSILLYSTNGTATNLVDTLATYDFGSLQQKQAVGLFTRNGTLYYQLTTSTFRSGTELNLYAHNGQANGSRFVTGGTTINPPLPSFGQNTVFSLNFGSIAGNNSSFLTFVINRKTATPNNITVFQYSWTTSNGPPTTAIVRPIAVTLPNDIFYCTINDTLVSFNSNGVKTVIKTGVGNAISGAVIGSTVYFVNEGNNLWQSDGTTTGTKRVPVQSLTVSDGISNGGSLYVLNNKLIYQRSTSGNQPYNIFAYNGTTEERIAAPPVALSAFEGLTVLGDKLYFLHNLNAVGGESYLYQSDGTEVGTTKRRLSAAFQECAVGSTNGFPCISNPNGFLLDIVGTQLSPNNVILNLPTATYGSEVWKVDLTGQVACRSLFQMTRATVLGCQATPIIATNTNVGTVFFNDNANFAKNAGVSLVDGAGKVVFMQAGQGSTTPPPNKVFTNCSGNWVYYKGEGFTANSAPESQVYLNDFAFRIATIGPATNPDGVIIEISSSNAALNENVYVSKSKDLDCTSCIVGDVTKPTFTNCPTAPVNARVDVGTKYDIQPILDFANITINDNCSLGAVFYNFTTFNAAGTYPINIFLYDAAGNRSVCNYTLNATLNTTNVNYCVSKSSLPWEFAISNVKFNTLNNTTDKFKDINSLGYSDYTSLSTTVNKGQTYPLSITPLLSWSGNLPNTFARAWIDFNQNKIFEANELVLEKTNASPLTSNVVIPSTALLGATRMRVSLKKDAYPTACETFEKGEVEDYTINIEAGTNPCTTDATPPVFSNCPTNKLITGSSLGCTPISWRVPTATDNCSTPSVSFVLKRGSTILNRTDTVVVVQLCPNNYTDTIVYTARDARGNVSTCQFEIKAVDRCITDRRDEGSLPTDQTLTTTNGNCVNFKWQVPVRFFPCSRFYSYEPWPLPTTSPSVTIGRADLRLVNNAPSGSVVLDSACFPIGTTLVNYVDLNGVAKTFKVTVSTASLPDFRMTAITQTQGSDLVNTTYRAEIDGFGVNYTVVNNGGNYVSPVTAFFYLSRDTILDSRDSFFTKLLAGAAGTFLAGGTVPNLPDGDYFLIGKANGDNAIPETNPNNNVFVLKTPTVKIRSSNVTDLAVFLSTNKGFYQPYSPLTYRINLENRGSVPFSNVKIEFKFPANTVSGGAAVPNIGTWQEWCAGGVQCFTWTIPTWPLTAPTPQLDIPLYVLNTNAPIIATAKLLSSTPVDANTVNNSATYTITQAPPPPTTQALAFQTPTQLIPVVIQQIAPNPTETDIQIKLDSWTKQEVDFNFSDITGKVMHSEKRSLEKGVNRVAFDVSYLPQGVYLIQTNVGKGKNVPTKFVKM